MAAVNISQDGVISAAPEQPQMSASSSLPAALSWANASIEAMGGAALTKGSITCLAVFAVLRAAPASAATDIYFHKPNVEKAVFVAELGTCIELAGGASPSRAQAYSASPYAAAIGGLFSGIMASREQRVMVLSIMRTCMADKGYRRVIAPGAVTKELRALDDESRSVRLYELATDVAPLGEVLPK